MDRLKNILIQEEKLNVKAKIIDRLVLAVVTEYKYYSNYSDPKDAYQFGMPEEYTRKVFHDAFGKYFKERIASNDPRYCLSRSGILELQKGFKLLQGKLKSDEWADIVNSLEALVNHPKEINGVAFEKILSSFHLNAPVINNIIETP